MKKILKKLYLCIITLALLLNSLPILVSAASNPYPSSQTINGVTTIPCTRYAWQQVYDRLGIALPNWGNAINWLNQAAKAGYTTGSAAKANSIAVWKSTAHSYGHVSFVTAVNGNYMTVNEGGMTNNSGNAANGTGIVTGSSVSSVVGTKKSAYSSCTLLGFIYLSNSPCTTISVTFTQLNDKNAISDKNAAVWCKIDKTVGVPVEKKGIRVRRANITYNEGWSKEITPSYASTNDSSFNMGWDMNGEVRITLLHLTQYYYQFYVRVGGQDFWSSEYTFTTTGSHNFGTWNIQKAATCTEKGKKSRKCLDCSKAENQTITALGHSYGNWNIEKTATCTTVGLSQRKCSVCSAVDTESISSLGHNFSTEWTIDTKVTCTTPGSKSNHCTRCSATNNTTTILPSGHNWGKWITEKKSTNKTEGLSARKCSECGLKETQTIAKLAADGHTHKFDEWQVIKTATCKENGNSIRTCSVCKELEQKDLLATGHQVGEWVEVSATCTSEGTRERICVICNETEKITIKALGHDFENPVVIKEPTDNEKGIKQGKCKRCGEETTEEIPALLSNNITNTDSDKKTDGGVENKNTNDNWVIWTIIGVFVLIVIGLSVYLILKKTRLNN